MVLVKGWMIWILRLKVYDDKILQEKWQCGLQFVFLKKWNLEFDANSAHMEYYPIWVRIPCLPLIRWLDEVFSEIGNALELFYEDDNYYREIGNMGMTRVLIGLYLTKNIPNSIFNRKGLSIFYHPLDYEEVPFKCGRYHIYRNLEEELLQKEP